LKARIRSLTFELQTCDDQVARFRIFRCVFFNYTKTKYNQNW